MMLVVVLDYTDGSVHFHKIPENLEDVEDYLTDELEYNSNFNWLEER